MQQNSLKKVVVIGGGTGTYPVITALKHLPVEISTIIAVSDSGGSTGRIRDEFGFQPVGDLRQSLAALAEDEGQEWIRKLLLYRFTKGDGLKGHNLGNLILTALQDMTGTTSEALRITEHIFRLSGQVIPVTEENVDLQITLANGKVLVGEHLLDDNSQVPVAIQSVQLVPEAAINPVAERAIIEADLIIIGPGDYYASIMACLVAHGTKAAFRQTHAKTLYMVNLMTRFTQTRHMSALDHVHGIEAALGKKLDFIVMNNDEIPAHSIKQYADSDEHPVVDDCSDDSRVIRAPLINSEEYVTSAVDTAHRSLLRHDTKKVQTVLESVLSKL